MEEKRFWSKKANGQQGVSRDLEDHLANPGQVQSTRLRRKINTDPWADWFNAGLDPEPVNDNFKAEPYFSTEAVIDNFSVQPEHINNPLFYSTQPTQAGYNPSFFPVAEYPPIVEESLAQVTEDGLPSASGEQQKTEEPEDEYEVSIEQENELDEETPVKTNHLVWREFPEKSC